ncbi:MAG: glucose-6-phosphate dehydrogenase assembly protein OpcA [Chthoniobacterales bacterium]|nr:glucose-6-phosphate dehydrogenase assembly protein OpcA [Chthoniobacterales bacterium]
MTATAPEAFSTGLQVEVGKIERELKNLWEQGGEMMSRASLINLAVYSEAPNSLSTNTQVVSEIAKDHACRALVIGADPTAPNDQVEAWINAHCHISRAGQKQICSEQISFSLKGSFAGLLPNIVFSHLDSDLPFYLWWQGEFHDPMDPQLWTWVDRLIYDSREWRDFTVQMRLIQLARTESNHRVVLCDLNWTRLVQLRLALAQFFDQPSCHSRLAKIERVEILFARRFRSTAILLIGWLAAQLGWTTDADQNDTALEFTDSAGKAIAVSLSETVGEPIGRCSIFCGSTELRVLHASEADLLEVSAWDGGKERTHQLMPAGSNEPVQLMGEELMRGGPHRVYLRAIEAVRGLL